MPRGTVRLGLAFLVLMLGFGFERPGLEAVSDIQKLVRTTGGKTISPTAEFESNPQLLFQSANRFNRQGLYSRALPLLELFVRKFPEHKDHQRAVYMLADANYFIAKTGVSSAYQNAAKAYVLALSLYPKAPQISGAYFRLAQSYKSLKNPAEAIGAFRNLVEKAPNSPHAPNALLEIAARYISLNDPQSAIIEYSQVLKKYKGSPAEKDAYFGIGNALSKERLFNDALKQFESGIERWPGYLRLRSDLLYNYAETLFQARRFEEAGRTFLRMVNINPSAEYTHRALARLGDIQLEQGNLENAAKVYMRVVSRYPRTEGAWVSLIRMADMVVDNGFKEPPSWIFSVEPLRDPVSAYMRVVEEAEKNRLSHVAYLRISNYYLKRGDLRRSIATVRKFLGKFPSTPLLNNSHLIMARAYFEEIRRFYSRQQFLRAIWSYAEFRTIIPTKVSVQAKPYMAMLEVGESYMRLGLYERGDKIFKEIMSDPQGVLSAGGEAIFRLAQSALLSGKIGNARTLAGRFVDRFPNGKRAASIRAILGEIAWMEGQPRVAIAHLTESLKGELDNELRGRSLYILSEVSAEIFRYSESVVALRKAIALYPQIPGSVKPFSLEEARFRIGDFFYEGRQKVGALVAYKEALEAYPNSKLVGWAQHRIRRVHGQLKLVGKMGPRIKLKTGLKPPSDPFWGEVNRLRGESLDWDKVNRPRLNRILGNAVAN